MSEIDGYKIIKVFLKNEDFQTLLGAQAAFRNAIDNPSEEAKRNASRMMRLAESVAVHPLCSAVENHEQEAH